MKTFQVSYTKGHLIDKETGKRIKLSRGGTFSISGDDDAFTEGEMLFHPQEIKSPEEQRKHLENKYGAENLVKIADAGDQLVFGFGLNKRNEEDEITRFEFNAILHEDLYFRKNQNYKKNGEHYVACDCACESTKCLYGNLPMYDDIPGSNLTQLARNLITFYFPFQHSGNLNIYKYFFFRTDSRHTYADLVEKRLRNLNDERQELAKKEKMADAKRRAKERLKKIDTEMKGKWK